MSREAHYTRVGAFVLGGIALAVATVLFVGSGSLFQSSTRFETYFEESVQGLEIGSPVKLRGVKIGEVDRITFVRDVYRFAVEETEREYGDMVLVQFEVTRDADVPRAQLRDDLMRMVDQGLRLRLAVQGLTGTSYVSADFVDPERYPPLELPWTPIALYIPSAPSTIATISSAAERLMARLDQLPVETILGNLDELLVTANTAVGELDAANLASQVGGLLDELRTTSRTLRGLVDDADLPGLAADARGALGQLEGALARAQRLLEGGRHDVQAALENLRVASENLRDATETARTYPSLLLLGEPPAPRDGGAEAP